jgi:molybdopterin-containing oxidoreductase family membrane subunit
MLEKALAGDKKYYGWITALLAVIGAGFAFYLWQFSFGLGITGMSRDVSWGFYIAQCGCISSDGCSSLLPAQL